MDAFKNHEFVARYEEGPKTFIPGFETLHRVMCQLLKERTPESAQILVLGAGGGLELRSMSNSHPQWRFCGIDPSREMLAQAKKLLGDAEGKVQWVEGLIFDAPEGPFDAATCLLTLHFVADDGSKLDTLKAIRSRLKPGAPFFVAHLCIDKTAPDASQQFERYLQYALESGVDPAKLQHARETVPAKLNCVAPLRDEELLRGRLHWSGTHVCRPLLAWLDSLCLSLNVMQSYTLSLRR